MELGSKGGGFTCKSRRSSGKISCRLKVGRVVATKLIVLSPPPSFVFILFDLPTGTTVPGVNVAGATVPGANVAGAIVPGVNVVGATVPGANVTGALVLDADSAHNPFEQKVHASTAPTQLASLLHGVLHFKVPDANTVGTRLPFPTVIGGSVPGASEAGVTVPGNTVVGGSVPFTGVNVIGAKVVGGGVPLTGTNVVGGNVEGDNVALTGANVVGNTVTDTGAVVVGASVIGRSGGLVATGGRVDGAFVANKLVGDGVGGGPGRGNVTIITQESPKFFFYISL